MFYFCVAYKVIVFMYSSDDFFHVCAPGNQKGSKGSAPIKSDVPKSPPPIEVPAIPLDELKEKTENFGSKALIGEGSYGRVYYANLSNGNEVAVRKLDVSTEPESNGEFLAQVCLQFFTVEI